MGHIKSIATRMLAFILCVSIGYPAKSQALPKKIEESHRSEAINLVTQFSKIYNQARKEFEKKGSLAFVEKINNLAPNIYTETELNFILKKISKLQYLPELEVEGNKLLVLEGSKKIHSLHTYDVARGLFILKGETLFFNQNLRLTENYENWTKNNPVKNSKLFFDIHNLLFKLDQLLLPQAHAIGKIPLMAILALIGGFIGYKWKKLTGSSSEEYTPKVHSQPLTTTQAAPVGTPTATPPTPAEPQPTTTQAGDAVQAPTDPPKPDTPVKSDYELAVDYLKSLSADFNFKTEEDFLAAKGDDSKFPTLACNTLAKFLGDLSLNKGEISKEILRKGFGLLTKKADGTDVPTTLNNAPIKVQIPNISGGTIEEDCSKVRKAVEDKILELEKKT